MSHWFWETDFDRPGDRWFDEPWFGADRWLGDDWRRSRRGDRWDRPGQALARGETGTITLRPRMDVHENRDKNTVTAMFDLPGMTKENVHISVQNGRLEVLGDSKIASEYEEGGFTVRERQAGRFHRSIALPQGVADKDIKANFENGVLTVTFPKTSEETAPKRISIS